LAEVISPIVQAVVGDLIPFLLGYNMAATVNVQLSPSYRAIITEQFVWCST
jgi:hypothetical protein